ncbi:hypothetical protein E0L36_03395 [Streptomyces sp. AJS327]|uniref:hypothetical protein n=1 Tax=Streptomyces sp. AJS327 TaxID=2545265 RepID=UPI0015DE376D|nr:hypothetical protein [Streptomyces sp. AJS327]MBA0049975.1 hypothetical protein [Streptomyces sp. AJS327]
MHKLLAAAVTCVAAAALAVGAAFGIVAALNATPEQPNEPLVHFHSSPDEVPGSGEKSATPSAPASPAEEQGSGTDKPGAGGDTDEPGQRSPGTGADQGAARGGGDAEPGGEEPGGPDTPSPAAGQGEE